MSGQQRTSSYFSSLEYAAKKRYLEKLTIDSLQLDDPLAIDESQWSKDLSQWPELEFGDIYTYLIETKGVYTK